jgi:type VI secretion system VasD/TssJ family lipoprotein
VQIPPRQPPSPVGSREKQNVELATTTHGGHRVRHSISTPCGTETGPIVNGQAPPARCIPPAMRTALLVTLLGIGACSAPAPEPKVAKKETCPPVATSIALSASDRSNATPEGTGRPVQVRVYQLHADTKLRGASFEEIWQKDKEVLATDLKSVAEYTVFPGKSQDIPVKRIPDANFLGLVALFREPKGTDWYVAYELTSPPQSPPCAKAVTIPVYLDRMHIQDGEGRGDSQGSPASTSSTATGAPTAKEGGT